MLSLSDGAFEDTFAIYFGFPTALVDGRVGETVHAASGPSGSRPLDEHGWALGTVQMAGEAVWRAASRDVQHVLFESINDAGIPVQRQGARAADARGMRSIITLLRALG